MKKHVATLGAVAIVISDLLLGLLLCSATPLALTTIHAE